MKNSVHQSKEQPTAPSRKGGEAHAVDRPMFTMLDQEAYKDDNGRDVAASEVDFIAPYKHICDGFYNWECGRCRREHSSRSCGWSIAGQVLKCEGCGAQSLLVKTNTIQIDELVKTKNELDLGLMRLASDRTAFDAEVKRAADRRIEQLKGPLRRLLNEIDAHSALVSPPDTNTVASTGTTE